MKWFKWGNFFLVKNGWKVEDGEDDRVCLDIRWLYINDSDSVSREGEANSHESIKEGT